MKVFFLILTTVFTILTFFGAAYVLINDGNVSAGYAVVPMVIAIACSSGCIAISRRDR